MNDDFSAPMMQDLDKVVVPQNADFSEELSLLIHLAKNYPDQVDLELNCPASDERIAGFESDNNIRLTDDLRTFYAFADGLSFDPGSVDLFPLATVAEELDTQWEWGDSRNYICIGDMIGDGMLILLDRDSGKIVTYDHGDEVVYDSVSLLLGGVILDFIQGEVDDDKLNDYISQWEITESDEN